MEYNKLIFVAQTGTCREAMAAGIMGDFTLRHPLEILSRGLVVQFQEPMNQKAEAVLISNGINMENYVSQQLTEEDLTEDALVITMEEIHRERILEQFENAAPEIYTGSYQICRGRTGNIRSIRRCFARLRIML